jgi:hypothetical protein
MQAAVRSGQERGVRPGKKDRPWIKGLLRRRRLRRIGSLHPPHGNIEAKE